MTVNEVKEYFEGLSVEAIPEAIQSFKDDTRKGVQQVCKKYQRQYNQYVKELERIELMGAFDQVFSKDGQYLVAGIDEAGRGPLAGPVVAAAVVLPEGAYFEGINDSKKLSAAQRERLYDDIMEKAISVGVGVVDADIIDEINILQATFRAMKKAVFSLQQGVDVLLVDGKQTIPGVSSNMIQNAVIKGDTKSMSIAAASIIAKVTRDRIMVEYNKLYPLYLFDRNKGYGSASHLYAIREWGPTKIHRMTFLNKFY